MLLKSLGRCKSSIPNNCRYILTYGEDKFLYFFVFLIEVEQFYSGLLMGNLNFSFFVAFFTAMDI